MSKAHVLANEHKNLREQIMFHLSFCLMMKFSGRDESAVKIVEEYAKAQGLWASNDIEFTDTLTLDMSTIVPTISGPKRPQDKVLLSDAANSFKKSFEEISKKKNFSISKVQIQNLKLKMVQY